MINKLDEITLGITQLKLDILFITETWAKTNTIPFNLYITENFYIILCNRKGNKKGGGYVK